MPDHYNDAMKEMRTRMPTSDAKQNAMMGLAEEGMKMAIGGGATSEAEMAAIRESIADLETMKDLIAMGMTAEQAMDEISRMKTAPINPSAFGGEKAGAPMGALGAMSDQDMAAFLQAQVAKSRADRGMGALAGVPAGNQMPMQLPRPRPDNLMMRGQSMGQDRTMNPMDRITPRNAPST
jgi:hypothetical protein